MTQRRFYYLFAALLLAAAGCGPSPPQELFDAAERAVASGELRTADIHLRNLLQQEPDNAAARQLLGRVSLSLGNAIGAEQELRRALQLGGDPAAVQLPLLQALLAQGKLAEVLEQVDAGPRLEGGDRTAALAIEAAAHRGLGALADAEAAYREALGLEPASPALRTDLAAVLLQAGRRGEALQIVADVLVEQPAFTQALLVRGAAELADARFAEAEATFAEFLAATPANAQPAERAIALAQLVESQLAQRKIEAAAANADALFAANPDAPLSQYLKARVEVMQEALDAAERRLEALIANAPQFWQAHSLLGSVNLRQEQFGQAQMYLQTAVTNQPQDATARLLLAETYVRQGQIESARRLIIGDNPNVGDALFYALIGRASLASGQVEQASEYFGQSEQAAPRSPAELMGVSNLLLAAGEFERAVRVIEASGVGDALGRYLLMLVRLGQGDVAAAGDIARALANELPEQAWPLNLQGIVALRAGDASAAQEFFARALAIAPDDVAVLLNAARAAAVEGDTEQAAVHFRRVIEIDPERPAAAAGLAGLALARRDFAEARSWLERIPMSPERVRLEGEIDFAEGRFEDAAAAFARAFAAQPSAQAALRAYAAASRAGRAEPEEQLVAWSERNPNDAGALFALGSIALTRGDEDEAIRRFEAATAVAPDYTAALNNLAWLYGERGDRRAEDLARRAYDAQPSPAIADTYGWVLLRNGKAAAARPLLEGAAEALPDNAEIQYHLAVALDETGDADRALEVLREILAAERDFRGRADAEALRAKLEGR